MELANMYDFVSPNLGWHDKPRLWERSGTPFAIAALALLTDAAGIGAILWNHRRREETDQHEHENIDYAATADADGYHLYNAQALERADHIHLEHRSVTLDTPKV